MKAPVLVTTAALVVANAIAASSFVFENHPLRASDLHHLNETEAAIFRSDQDATVKSSCNVFAGDRNWPRRQSWDTLAELTDGSLIASAPRASSCYSGPRYDAADCKSLSDQWTSFYFQ